MVALHLRTKFVDAVGDEDVYVSSSSSSSEAEVESAVSRGGAQGRTVSGSGSGGSELFARASRTLAGAPGNFSLHRIRRGGADARWSEFNRMLAAGGFTRRNDDELMDRCPHVTPDSGSGDGGGGGGGGDLFRVGGADAAGLSPYLTCAGRAAQLAATERAAGGGNASRWSLYVATDAPYVKRLTSMLPALRGRVVGCRGRCVFLHTSHGAAASEDGEAIDRFLQSFVDGYIVGLADHCLPVTASTFPQLAHRGFGVGGRPQMLDRDWDGFTLQGGGEAWSNKHLPLCEAAGLRDDDGDVRCRDVYAAVLGRGRGRRGGMRGV